MNLSAIQSRLRADGIAAWLVYDFRGSSPVLERLFPGRRHTTRRMFLLIPAEGRPRLLSHGLDAAQFAGLPVEHDGYTGWRDLKAWLAGHIARGSRVAMEYSPGCALPVVSSTDAGTVELVRECGAEVVSSENLIQTAVAVWSEAAVREHERASHDVAAAKDSAFALVRERLASGAGVNELEVQRHILDRFRTAGLEWPDPPIVGVNAHSGDPHYDTSQTDPAPVRRGDWLLIDLWARVPGDENIFSDITWVGVAAEAPTPRQLEVFNAVRAARDAAVDRVVAAWKAKERLAGWQLDEAAADRIRAAGFGDAIKHRTGHSLSPGPRVHGLGFNLDNLETHDTREVLPGLGFTIEPGIYLPEFGVRLEINMYVDPESGPRVTSCLQRDVLTLC